MEQKELLTVIVADDETELREAVCSMIPWKEIGFRLVGSAGNGLDALQLVEQLQPDLLLTDIRMPYISGVSLAQQVRELRPLTQIAFLSGYDDFAYAQKAIEYNVISYLLKPISMRELTEALAEIRGKIRRKFARLLPQKPEKSGWRELLLPLLLDGFAEEAQQDDPALRASLVGAGILAAGQERYSLTVLAIRLEQDGKNDLIQNMTPRMVLDYLGIVTDGEKLADADFQFRLQLVTNAAGEPAVWQAGEAFQVQAEFAVHVYHGTILYYEGHTEESLPLIRIATAAFPAITAKNLETLLPFVETEHLEYLQQIHDAVVDLNQHSQFALIEPNRENH